MSAALPFAVYGTLRPGQRLATSWEGMISTLGGSLGQCVNHGHVAGFRLTTNNAYPYAIPDPAHRIVVDIIAPLPGKADELLKRFDGIEGYPHHYDRVQVTVETEYGDVEAWLYTPASRHFDHFPPVPGNDWSRYVHDEDQDDEGADDEDDFCECDVPRSIIVDVCQLCGKVV